MVFFDLLFIIIIIIIISSSTIFHLVNNSVSYEITVLTGDERFPRLCRKAVYKDLRKDKFED